MADESIALDILVKADGTVKTVSDIKQEIKDLTNEAIKAKAAGDDMLSAKFLDQAGKAKDALNDIREEVAALDPGAKAQAFVNLGQTIAGGFAAATAASQMFKVSNETIEQQLLKVQQATALLQGVQAIADAKRSIEIVKQIALVNLQSGAENKNIVVRYAAIAAQRALNMVMSANPIMLVVTAVVALIGAYKLLGNEAEKSAEEIEEANRRKVESEKEAQERIQKIRENGLKLSRQVQDAQLGIMKDGQEKEIEAIRIRYDRERDEINQQIMAMPFAAGKLTELRLAKEEEEAQAIAKIKEKYAKQEEDKDIERFDKEKERRIRQGEERTKILELETANRKAQLDIIAQAEEEKRLQEEELKMFRAEQDLKDAEAELEMLKMDIETNGNATIEAKLAVLAREHELVLESEDLSYQERQLREKQFQENRRKLIIDEENKIRGARLSVANSTVKGLNALNDILINDSKKHAKFAKALALTQIAIDTAKSIASLTAMSQANPTNAVTFGASGIVQFAAGLAQILANIAQAKQVLSQSDQHGITGGSTSTPVFNIPQASPINYLPPEGQNITSPTQRQQSSTLIDEEGNTGGGNLRVYVLESDIRDALRKVTMIENSAIY